MGHGSRALSYYSLKNNFIFLHAPKNGGTSIHTALRAAVPDLRAFDEIDEQHREERDPGFANHFTLEMISRLCKAQAPHIHPEKMGRFVILRNPWARMVSLYNHRWKKRHLSYEGKPRNSPEDIKVLEKGFKAWLLTTQHPGDARLIVTPALDWLRTPEGFDGGSFLRLEDLNTYWDHLLEVLGAENVPLPHVNVGPPASYREFYDEETRDFVATFHERDIHAGKYNF
jgi:hypothetical protein